MAKINYKVETTFAKKKSVVSLAKQIPEFYNVYSQKTRNGFDVFFSVFKGNEEKAQIFGITTKLKIINLNEKNN